MKDKEKEIIAYWDNQKINEKLREARREGKRFYFLDGPPYVTGDLHPGHIWVKTLKDLFVRYKRYRGFNVVDRAGYDVHGLPIENKVEKELNINSKKEIESKIGIDKFVNECDNFVRKYIGRIDADYKRYGISLDFSNPYLPNTSGYIESAWNTFKIISDKGFLYEGRKTLIYCPHCETPVSQGSMEVEYRDEDDPSVYVAFAVDTKRSKAKIELKDNTHLLVWTTTPWTLPSNMAIAANPKQMYVIAESGGKRFIFAKERMESVAAVTDTSFVVTAEFYGSELDGLFYTSPLEQKVEKQKEFRKYHKVIFSEQLVSMGEGTGLVHIAPGNGVDDYSIGVKNKIPIFSPLNPDATYNKDAGVYEGLRVPSDANRAVIKDLEENGTLIKRDTVRHSYPHCWRCSNKLIFLATKQWFLNVKKVKKKLIKANEKIKWYPNQVRDWQRAILENSPDWCISRQRYWGIPMPVWVCGKCSEISVIGSFAELKARTKNKEYVNGMTDMHRPYIDKVVLDCAKCGGEQTRIKDILDVWFDSSIAFRASLAKEQFGEFTPTELVVEYVEQIRGWFQYMLKIGIMAYGKSPMKNVVVHGILAGNDGRKMSKSFGNYRPLSELANFASADAFRIWSISHDPILNRNLSESEIKDNEKAIIILHNVSNLLEEYKALLDYRPERKSRISTRLLDKVDVWIVSKLETLVGEVTASLEGYDACRAAELIKQFIIEDLSRFYLKSAKRSVGEKRKGKKIVDLMNYVLFKTIVLASPIIPFVAESVYLEHYNQKESIFFEDWPKQAKRSINKEVEEEIDIAREVITAILNNREKRNVKLRAPILSATVETNNEKVINVVERLATLIESYTNTKKMKIVKGAGNKKEISPVFGKIGPAFKQNAKAVADELKLQDADAVEREINKSGYFSLHTSAGTFDIKPEHFAVTEKQISEGTSKFKDGIVTIDATQTAEIKEELLLREISRRVQLMRKEKGMTRADIIVVYIEADPAVIETVKLFSGELKEVVKAKKIELGKQEPTGIEHHEFEIDGVQMKIGIEKT